MQRRQFLNRSFAGSALLLGRSLSAQPPRDGSAPESATAREFYQLRRYHLQSGPQTALTEQYFAEAMLPALGRLGMGPIGAFRITIGPETPSYYLLIPSTSVEALVTLDQTLAHDDVFLKAAEPLWAAPATAPAFLRVESALLSAFPGWRKITPPAKGKRIFQLRTYESPSFRDHARKVEMFGDGEIDIFLRAGFHPVFFGDQLVGPKGPSLTYMMAFGDMAELEAKWHTFSNDPDWKKMKATTKYGFEEIVSNIANIILEPLAMSRI
jgi:hypothetical protein